MVLWDDPRVLAFLAFTSTMLSAFVEVTYTYAYSLFEYFRGTWPLSLVYGPPLQPPSSSTKRVVHEAIRHLKQGGSEDDVRVDVVLELLDLVPRQEDVLAVVDDENGFDILQHAVMYGGKDVVQRLLRMGCCCNRYHCSPPHHLAAYLGRTHILKLLLDHGANASSKKGMCFPEPHKPVGCKMSYFGFTQQQVYLCHSHSLTPIQCAIQQGRIDCVRMLTDTLRSCQDKRAPPFSPLTHLQYACKEGAADCIRYFVTQFPECINQYGPDGDTPLLTAVPWGEECVKILVDNGADVHLLSRGIGETALHRLYRMNIDGLFSIYDTTRYLLTTGIEQDINSLTDLGETPLHMLVSHVSYAGGNYVDPSRHHLTRSELQGDYQSQVVLAIRALLEFNADPLMVNGPGLQPLSRMLHIALKACHRDDACPCVRTSQPDMFIVEYCNDYCTLAEAMNILLEHGAPPNFKCSVGHTPLILLMQCFLHDDVRSLASQAQAAVGAVETLILGGANVNFTDNGQNTAATLIAMVCRRCLTDPTIRGDAGLMAQFADFTDNLLRLLLSHGLDPNHTTARSSPFLRGGSGNALIEFVRLAELATTSRDFSLVLRWMRTLLQWGADPDIEPYQSEPIICHSQSSIFLKKQGTQPVSHYLHDARERQTTPASGSEDVGHGIQALLELFYNSMDHKALYDCLHAARGISRLHLHESLAVGMTPKDNFLSMLHCMAETPRSLKQIARVAVYKALDRQVAAKVDELPIPWAVKQYLLEFS
ncbi:hypothetical protein BaRGS_00025463 [Batillaria attramentaria]|uniref:SOCS box domain-containing protein n=1 Tax=Batillaria attramentaria TaxID=370345 RepID=A0ABD0K877_9CAEN